jgi:predicted  nucleic acid-binding Zn-ribbon protein
MPDTIMSRSSPVPDAPASFSSAERANLAAAIARFDQLAAHLDDVRQRAVVAAEAAVSQAWNARDAADRALREAAGSAAQQALARALGGARPTITELEDALTAARKRYEAAQRDRDLVNDEVKRISTAVDFARVERDQALAAVLAPAAAELLAELTANRRRILFLENTIFAIRKLVPIGLPMDWSTPGERRTPADWVPDADVLALWSEAIAALQTDATAPLPGDDD